MNKDLKNMRGELVVFVEVHIRHRVGRISGVVGGGGNSKGNKKALSRSCSLFSFEEAQ